MSLIYFALLIESYAFNFVGTVTLEIQIFCSKKVFFVTIIIDTTLLRVMGTIAFAMPVKIVLFTLDISVVNVLVYFYCGNLNALAHCFSTTGTPICSETWRKSQRDSEKCQSVTLPVKSLLWGLLTCLTMVPCEMTDFCGRPIKYDQPAYDNWP